MQSQRNRMLGGILACIQRSQQSKQWQRKLVLGKKTNKQLHIFSLLTKKKREKKHVASRKLLPLHVNLGQLDYGGYFGKAFIKLLEWPDIFNSSWCNFPPSSQC